DLVEIEIEDRLQGFAGGAIAGGFGKRFEPVAVLVLQRTQFGDSVMPALRSAAAVGRPTISDDPPGKPRDHPGVGGAVAPGARRRSVGGRPGACVLLP